MTGQFHTNTFLLYIKESKKARYRTQKHGKPRKFRHIGSKDSPVSFYLIKYRGIFCLKARFSLLFHNQIKFHFRCLFQAYLPCLLITEQELPDKKQNGIRKPAIPFCFFMKRLHFPSRKSIPCCPAKDNQMTKNNHDRKAKRLTGIKFRSRIQCR